MTFAALGDSAVLATLGEVANESVLTRVRLLAEALDQARIPGITDVVPAYATVAIFYDVRRWTAGERSAYDSVCEAVKACAASAGIRSRRLRRRARERLIEIPVCYGGEEGPDLEAVALNAKLTAAEVVKYHAAGSYRVQAIGFAPGFPYLTGLPPALKMARRPTPRTSVPSGSVAIGAAQTGIYPLETPGGWQLIGRTPLSLFRAQEEAPALLRMGDRVKFRAIDHPEFVRLKQRHRPPVVPAGVEASHGLESKPPAFEVVHPGLLTTVQDLGRPGHRASGLPVSGAMDPFALRLANLLVGNPEGAAGLEITLRGPELLFAVDTVVAVGGAEFAGVPTWRPMAVRAGERLKFGECLQGCRAYLAIAGGIDVPLALGSRSTYLRADLGGYAGRALRSGDRLPAGSGRAAKVRAGSWRVSPSILPAYAAAVTLRVLAAAQTADYGPRFWSAEFRVSPQSDRMGLRLECEQPIEGGKKELVSSAVAPGTVQVPPDGRAILLMADAQTIGGYPQAAHVIGPDLPLAAQLRPGDRLRFRPVSLEEAQGLAAARERDLAHLRAGLQS